jgi:hypothetical protein
MELAGLEPAASWVRCGNAMPVHGRCFRLNRAEAWWLTSVRAGACIAADYRGLRSIWAPEATCCPFIFAARSPQERRRSELIG